jgi:phage terminase Nu1 subunit (DNA packaging protein)
MTTKLINENKTTEILDISIHKLQKDRRVGSPIPFIRIGRSIKYDLADVMSYIERQKFSSTSEYKGGV